MKKKDFLFVIFSFFIWRIVLFIIAYISTKIIPLQELLLGGKLVNYLKYPLFWGWANFDGEHYIAIAQNGFYGLAEQAFFPLYIILMKFFAEIINIGIVGFNLSGLLISNISFLIGLVGFYKLLRVDYESKIAKICIILLLVFPTSFYFVSTYAEGLFFALTIWAFYFARNNKWLFASILAMFASATKVMGILLFPAFLFMILKSIKFNLTKLNIKHFSILLIPLGILFYMYYLYIRYNDPLLFIRSLPFFGEQRSAIPILLPQVFYRYFFKIIPHINYSYFPNVYVTFLELTVSLIFLGLSIISIWKLNIGYWMYLILGFLLSSISGSFSSLPRYVAVLFPAFILISLWLDKLPKVWKSMILGILFVLLVISQALFFRGYWVS
jgi:Gpi18-like mannosyltransferase